MTVNVVPKHWPLSGDVMATGDKHLVVECEVVLPKGWAGRTVYVHFSPEDVTSTLLAMRDAARRARL